MTKAKKWKIAIIVLLGFVATVLIAIGRGKILEVSRELYSRRYLLDDKIRD